MMKRFVIVHARDGVYLGSEFGKPSWSTLDVGRWTGATTFESAQLARDHINNWAGYLTRLAKRNYRLVEVDVEGNPEYADIPELRAAGLGHLVSQPMIWNLTMYIISLTQQHGPDWLRQRSANELDLFAEVLGVRAKGDKLNAIIKALRHGDDFQSSSWH